AEDGIRDFHVTGVQTCALPISWQPASTGPAPDGGHRLRGPQRGRPRLRLTAGMGVVRREEPARLSRGPGRGPSFLAEGPRMVGVPGRDGVALLLAHEPGHRAAIVARPGRPRRADLHLNLRLAPTRGFLTPLHE